MEQNRKTLNPFLVVVFLFLVSSCEYQSDKEFVNDLPEPSAYIEVDLQLLPQKDTIDLYLPIILRYNFSSEGKKLISGHFKMGGKEWEVKSLTGYITLVNDDYWPGLYNLSLTLILSSGSGSIADQLGAEGYLVEKEWVVNVNRFQISKNPLRHSKNSDGYLTISWDPFDYYNFHSYEIIRSDMTGIERSITITNPLQSTYIDSCFFGISTYYSVLTRVMHDGSMITGGSNRLVVASEAPGIEFELLGQDSVRVKWNKTGYPTRYTLRVNNIHPRETYLEASTDTSIVITNLKFGNFYRFDLLAMSSNIEKCNYTAHLRGAEFSLGKIISHNARYFAYDFDNRILYENNFDGITTYNIDDLEVIKTIDLGSPINIAVNNTRVVAGRPYDLHVFRDKNLSNPDIIYYNGISQLEYLFLTNNDKIAVVVGEQYRLYDANKKELDASFNIADMPLYSPLSCIGTSSDAGYAGITTLNGIWIYQRNNNQYDQIYHNDQSYRSILFDPDSNDHVYITRSDNADLIRYKLPEFHPQQSWTSAKFMCAFQR
jgi:hypothetical protein